MFGGALALLLGCEAPPARQAPPAPVAVDVTAQGNGEWTLARAGEAPIFARGERRLFVGAAGRGDQGMLPGLAIGSAKGPLPGFLGGHLAPLVGLGATGEAVAVKASGAPLTITFGAGQAPGAQVVVLPDLEGRGRLRITGAVVLWLPADRTALAAEHRRRPSFATTLSAGADPSVRAPLADRLDIDTVPYGRVTVETSCPRPRLIQPVARGSTSVFGIQLGPATSPDPFYAPPWSPHPELAGCGPTTTSTLTFGWP